MTTKHKTDTTATDAPGCSAKATQSKEAPKEFSHCVLSRRWDKGKGDYMAIVESKTKWMSYDLCRAWIDTHFFDTAEIIERETGKCVGSFGNSESEIADRESTSLEPGYMRVKLQDATKAKPAQPQPDKGYEQKVSEAMRELVQYKAHAEALAEALDLNMRWIGAPPKGKFDYDSLRETAWDKGQSALAAWQSRVEPQGSIRGKARGQ